MLAAAFAPTVLVLTAALTGAPAAHDAEAAPLKVLVLTGGGYHDFTGNTPALLEGVKGLAARPIEFTTLKLATRPREGDTGPSLADEDIFSRHDVVLAYMQGELGFTDDVKARFLSYVREGGGYVAIHSAGDSHPGWDEYDKLLGGRFEYHPPFGPITVKAEVTLHPIMKGVDTTWELNDEFYHLQKCAEDDKLVLMRGRSPGEAEDAPTRPVAWEKNYGEGRVFYTILGHGRETHEDARFHRLIANAVVWAAEAPRPDSEGRYHLLTGERSGLERNWSMAGPGGFRCEQGEIVAYGGMGLFWYHQRRFRDFTLELEFMTTRKEDNSGVFVRFMKPSDDPWYAVRHGHEIQICDTAGPKQRTGSVYSYADAEKGPEASFGPGKWNRYEITVRGDEYTVVLNGKQILQWTSPSDRHGREGYIGLQNHDDSSPVRYRNITVRELN